MKIQQRTELQRKLPVIPHREMRAVAVAKEK